MCCMCWKAQLVHIICASLLNSDVYMKCGRATPEADTHDRTVCIVPISAEVTDKRFDIQLL